MECDRFLAYVCMYVCVAWTRVWRCVRGSKTHSQTRRLYVWFLILSAFSGYLLKIRAFSSAVCVVVGSSPTRRLVLRIQKEKNAYWNLEVFIFFFISPSFGLLSPLNLPALVNLPLNSLGAGWNERTSCKWCHAHSSRLHPTQYMRCVGHGSWNMAIIKNKKKQQKKKQQKKITFCLLLPAIREIILQGGKGTAIVSAQLKVEWAVMSAVIHPYRRKQRHSRTRTYMYVHTCVHISRRTVFAPLHIILIK